MTIYVPNGSGLETAQGFSTPDGSGYVLPKTNYGCPQIWSGFFVHRYAGASPGADLGAAWFQQKATTTGMKSSGLDITNINVRDVGQVICSSIPVMTHCRMQASWVSATWGVGVDGAGPAGYITEDSGGGFNGYTVRIFNFNGDITVTNRVVVSRMLSNTETTVAVSKMPDDVNGGGSGPLGPHTYILELNIVSSVHSDDVSIKVYVDSVLNAPIVNIVDSTSSRICPSNNTDPFNHSDLWPSRKPGVVGGANTVFGHYIVTDLD